MAQTDSDSMKIPEFSDLVRSLPSQARDEDDLWTLAEEQKSAGDRRLHSFMIGRRDVAQQPIFLVSPAVHFNSAADFLGVVGQPDKKLNYRFSKNEFSATPSPLKQC